MVNLHPAHSAIDAQIASCRMLLYISDVRHLSHPLDCGFNCTRHGRRRKQALHKAACSSSDLAIKGGNIKSFFFLIIVDHLKPSENHRETGSHPRLQSACLSPMFTGESQCIPAQCFCSDVSFLVLWPQRSGGTITWINELLSYLGSFIYQPFDELWLSLCRIAMQFAILPQLPLLEESQPGCLFPPHLTETQRPRWGQPQCRLARHSSTIKICLFDNVTPDNQFTRTSTASGNLNHRQRWTGPPLALSQAITPKLKTSRRQFHDGASIFPAFARRCDVTFSQGNRCRQYKWLMNEIWISRHCTV